MEDTEILNEIYQEIKEAEGRFIPDYWCNVPYDRIDIVDNKNYTVRPKRHLQKKLEIKE